MAKNLVLAQKRWKLHGPGIQLDEFEAPGAASIDDVLWSPANRVGNTEWCECGQCAAMANRFDCQCCHDAAITLELTRANGDGCSCVTQIPDFEGNILLHQRVLLLALQGYFETWPVLQTDQPDNRKARRQSMILLVFLLSLTVHGLTPAGFYPRSVLLSFAFHKLCQLAKASSSRLPMHERLGQRVKCSPASK